MNDERTLEISGVTFSHEDIATVVETFYRRVEKHEALKVPFQSVHDWPEHIVRLTHFWWIRFGGEPYMFSHYNPVQKHFFAGFNQELLSHWLKLFHQVLDEKLETHQAELWKEISTHMGQALSKRNEIIRKEYENSK